MTFDPSKVSLTDVDPVSNVPYLHESFVLHTFVPIRYVRRQKPFDDPTFTGMYPDGYRIPTVLTYVHVYIVILLEKHSVYYHTIRAVIQTVFTYSV
jgi:hypothetical protein